ncbi:MAG: hypothetical protein M1115_06600 [Actinobacteria bacterium]|nr:hypothetical protein [Actinomycetota bacterium]
MEICPPGAIRDLSTAESLPQRTAS